MKLKIAVCTGTAAVALFAGAGIASAQPDIEAIVNSTCSYPQVVAALNVEAPQMAGELTSNPMASGWLQNLVASPPSKRRVLIAQVQGYPEVQQYTSTINSVAHTCSNY